MNYHSNKMRNNIIKVFRKDVHLGRPFLEGKMNKEDNKVCKFTPEELGLEKITVGGHRYIDVTPFWIDSKKSREIQSILKDASLHPEECKKGAEKK